MPFKRYYDREYEKPPREEERYEKTFTWHLSAKAVEVSSAGSTVVFTLILLIVWILRLRFQVEQSDIYAAVSISAGLGALSLAVPLFLRDFNIQQTLWRSFLILATVFIVTTCVGVVTFLIQSGMEESQLMFAGFISVIVVINFRTAIALRRLFKFWKFTSTRPSITDHRTDIYISPTQPDEFILIIVLAITCIITCEGLPSTFLILFAYGIMLLLSTLSASIISSFTYSKMRTADEESKYQLKVAIQEILENNPERAFSEQELLDALRSGPYKVNIDLISRPVIQTLVSDMDNEFRENAPKVTVWEYDKVIPRWNNDYQRQILEKAPTIFVFKGKWEYLDDDIRNTIVKLQSKASDELLPYLSTSFNISIELLRDANILPQILSNFNQLWTLDLNSNRRLGVLYVENTLSRYKIDINADPIDFIRISDMNLRNDICFTVSLENDDKRLLLAEFAAQIILKQSNGFAQIIENDFNNKSNDEFIDILTSEIDGMTKGQFVDNIMDTYSLKFGYYSHSRLKEIVKRTISDLADDKLCDLRDRNLISNTNDTWKVI